MRTNDVIWENFDAVRPIRDFHTETLPTLLPKKFFLSSA